MRTSILSLALILGAALLPVNARMSDGPRSHQDKPASATTTTSPEPWTVDDVVMAESASQFEISPDGHWVVWVKTVPDKEKNGRTSNLILSSLMEKNKIQLTRGKYTHSNPRWSPNGHLIAFISTRPVPKGKKPTPSSKSGPRRQLWLINPFGGEPWHLTQSERSVRAFEWADERTILFTAQEDLTFYERSVKEKKDTSIVVDDEPHEPPVRLFRIDVESKQVTRLTSNDDWIQQLAVSPDGRYAVAIHNRSLTFTYDQRVRPATFLHDLKTGEHRQLFTEGKILPQRIRWARDGKGFYVSSAFTHHPTYQFATISHMYYYELASGTVIQVNLDWANGLSQAFQVTGGYQVTDDGFITLLAYGVRPRLARYIHQADTRTWKRAWITGEHVGHIFGLTVSQDGQTVVYNTSTASMPTQWVRARLDGSTLVDPVQLTDLNPQLKNRRIAKTEVVHWKGARDEEVEGLLYYPHNFEPGKRYPLVVMIHGGPAGADLDRWSDRWGYPHNLMTQRGAFVFTPNYHGSSSYGLAWVESIGEGNYYDLEVPDIERGVDSLIARGLIDPDRLGVMGWSNGAILTTALTVTTTRYKVASAGAGDVDWASDWGNCAFGASFDNYYFGASPLESPEVYIRKSPFYRMKNVRTPTILFHGTEDTSVPTEQSWMHYRALQQLGQTDVRFILFPGEPHGLRKLAHQHRKVEEELAWFDKYLFKTAAAADEALKPESPLAVMVKMRAVKRTDDRYGALEKGVLIPETVRHGTLELGRFEVTRAQYAAYDKSYPVESGRENYPASGISFEHAKAYCEWLSRLTGETYRLGSVAEMKPFYKKANSGENTLDYWAGYRVNPDDAERLKKELEKLDGEAPLLRPVGSFKPFGHGDLIFDLGGNVAEWVTAEDGSGRLMGGSADAPADPKLRQREPAPKYTGFRVVKDAHKR